MKLSIVIPCYNMQEYLPACLNSLVEQDISSNDLQIILVNDGSIDQTLQIAQNYAEKYNNIIVIDKVNNGVGAARNTGLDHATGTYIYFLDPDDYIASNCLTPLLKLIELNNLDILSFKSTPVKQDNYKIKVDFRLDKQLNITDGISYISNKKYQNEIWWFFIKTNFLKESKIRFIEGRWMEDAILTAKLFCAAKRMAHVNWNVHRYRILPTSAMRNKSSEHYNKVIFDNANAAEVFDELIKSIDLKHEKSGNCIKRLRTRQQSFVFFLLVRLMKSDLNLSEIKPLLHTFKSIGAYPLNNFLGEDYNGISYKILVFVLNNKPLIIPFMKIYRLLTMNFK